MKLEQGDAFEQNSIGWLRQELPHYEPLWSAFIGNNGRSHPLPMPGLSQDKERARKTLYQAHYSAAFGCFEMAEAVKQLSDGLGLVKDFNAFARECRQLHAFMSWVGHVRDMYHQMDGALGLRGTVVSSLQEFYDLRSHVMHGPRMPMKIEDGLIKIPRVAKRNKVFSEWDDKSFWDDFKDVELVYMVDFCTEAQRDFFVLVRECHGKIYSAACDYFGDLRIQEIKNVSSEFHWDLPSSPAVSVWTLPSGDCNG